MGRRTRPYIPGIRVTILSALLSTLPGREAAKWTCIFGVVLVIAWSNTGKAMTLFAGPLKWQEPMPRFKSAILPQFPVIKLDILPRTSLMLWSCLCLWAQGMT